MNEKHGYANKFAPLPISPDLMIGAPIIAPQDATLPRNV